MSLFACLKEIMWDASASVPFLFQLDCAYLPSGFIFGIKKLAISKHMQKRERIH